MDAAGQPRGRYGRLAPRPGLTPEAIATAGRALVERDGLDSLTMRAVAAELDTAATSLYRHVADRDALLVAILEQVALDLPVEVEGRTPRARLRRRFVRFHDYMAGHIWVLHVLVGGSLVATNALPFVNACIADFRAAGLGNTAATRAYRTCWQFTLGELLDTHPLVAPARPTQRERAMAAVDADELPMIGTLLDDYSSGDERDAYARALDTVLAALLH